MHNRAIEAYDVCTNTPCWFQRHCYICSKNPGSTIHSPSQHLTLNQNCTAIHVHCTKQVTDRRVIVIISATHIADKVVEHEVLPSLVNSIINFSTSNVFVRTSQQVLEVGRFANILSTVITITLFADHDFTRNFPFNVSFHACMRFIVFPRSRTV